MALERSDGGGRWGAAHSRIQRLIGRIKNPEYTGSNRCTPCTVVNLLLAAIATAAVLFVSPVASVVVAILSVLGIYLRGYLVPGTPTLTKRYLPERVLRWFDKEPDVDASDDAYTEADVEEFLLEEDVLVEGDVDLELDPEFRSGWIERMGALTADRTDTARFAEMLDVAEDQLEVDRHDDAFVVQRGDVRVGQWESRAAFVADMAATKELAEYSPTWSSLSMMERSEILGGLRIFLDWCPQCGGPITLGQDVVESCCRSHDVVVASCQDCGSRLFETPFSQEMIEEASTTAEENDMSVADT